MRDNLEEYNLEKELKNLKEMQYKVLAMMSYILIRETGTDDILRNKNHLREGVFHNIKLIEKTFDELK